MKRTLPTAVVTAVAVALAAGVAVPAAASGSNTRHAFLGSRDAGSPPSDIARRSITLITGDRVLVDATGRAVGFERAKGREHIPVRTQTVRGHTLVVPFDAARLINSGRLDQRLFDVTELDRPAVRKAQNKGLKVIVGYQGATAAAARDNVRTTGDTRVRRTLEKLDADAVVVPRNDAKDLWDALTREQAGGFRTTASGISQIWLDGVRRASLDESVPQTGAPSAWSAGYDGKGVKIAVLDTGVDATHPDLKNQVVAEKNFTASADARDRQGHGTHVASTAAGTGAKSGGTHRGVAPGAKLLNGKVLDDDGVGDDSGILAGMEWAAEQGADIVNLSLGSQDSPGVDPLEAEVNKLSAQKGILFTVAAGNNGPQTVTSPGTADAALTVGAVDGNDRLADFSSTGPRVGDGAIKPDVTAPGVDITAAAAPGSTLVREVGENPPGYLTVSGTSMATPHVAGAAAILKQEHPDWTYAELKGALTGSAKSGGYTPFEQGAGRLSVDNAVKQSVVAEPVSLNFGTQKWPHTDDAAITRKLTYRNLGRTEITLGLTVTAKDPEGQAAPDGFFQLGAQTVTVPAGGTASVTVTADTRKGTLDGTYSAYVTATHGGQSVRTAATVTREVESYDVTVKHIGRDGRPSSEYTTGLQGHSGLAEGTELTPYDPSGTVRVRVPKGDYLLDSQIVMDPNDARKGVDWLAQPKLSVTKDETITLDARTTKPVDITVPDAAAEPVLASALYTLRAGGEVLIHGAWLESYTNFRTRHLGPQITDGSLFQQFDGHWTKGALAQYDTTAATPVKQLATGFTKHYKATDLATVRVGLGASSAGKEGAVTAVFDPPGLGVASAIYVTQKLPSTRTLYLSTDVGWTFGFKQHGALDSDGRPSTEAAYWSGTPETFEAGKTYRKTFNTGVFGPLMSGNHGVFRDGNTIVGRLPVYADGHGHDGTSMISSVRTVLHRNGTKLVENADPLDGTGQFEVPAEDAEYRLTSSVQRSAEVGTASTRIDTSWTFRSGKTTAQTQLPLSTARFNTALDLDSTAPAGKTQSVGVSVQGAAGGSNLKSLTVRVSYDDGRSWSRATVTDDRITVRNPAKGKGISLRAEITDKQGNTSKVSIHNAYYGK
ncbi:S8 family peptidase [Streptomyces sp. NPDC018947]|uniref:S8 family peptidase n=1 Tax=Streptomyces sp. NPDC018947 TaxID=3365054 RepID=UPI0037A66917